MLSDSILSNAGWLFFAAYSVMVAAVSIAAFGPDLLAARAQVDLPQKHGPADPAQPPR